MTITEAIATTYLLATGKASATSASKKAQIVALLNFYQKRWSREIGVDWNSLYDPLYSLGNITATDTFDLDTSTIRKLSDREGDVVRVVWTNGTSYMDYALVNADSLKDYSTGVTKQGLGSYATRIGNTLVFNHTFTTSNSQYGGELFVPAYIYPDEITNDNPESDEVQVDDPDWLCVRSAAAYARNNITLRSRYPELITEANEIMQRMKEDNSETQISEVIRPWTPGINSDSAWD